MYKYVTTPFNIDLLLLNKDQLRRLGKITTGRIMEPSTQNFDPEGLFSPQIFGPVGSQERNSTFGYIDLKVDLVHPLVYDYITSLKSFYKDILAGKKYAIFDNKLKDFVPSNIEDGKTGYFFFFEYFDKIKLEDNDSEQRAFKLKVIEAYKKQKDTFNALLVLPAGLRDYTVGNDGKATEDEVNDLYRRVIMIANNLDSVNLKNPDNLYLLSGTIYKLQEAVLAVYNYFFGLINGKHKFTEGKWAKRAIQYGTRNVLTPQVPTIKNLNDPDKITLDMSIVGLYQYVKSITPITINKLLNKFIYRIMSQDSNSALLVDVKTLKSVNAEIPLKKRDDWITAEGLEQMMNKLAQESLRVLPVKVDKFYLMNIYDNGKIIKPIFNTAEVDEADWKYLRPITYAELLYLAIEDVISKYPALVTRYPVANAGGVYPSKVYVRTTMNPRTVEYTLNGITKTLKEYPNLKEKFINGMSVSTIHLKALGR